MGPTDVAWRKPDFFLVTIHGNTQFFNCPSPGLRHTPLCTNVSFDGPEETREWPILVE